MIKIVIFDIDGTLLDVTEFIYQAFEHTLHAYGMKTSREEMSIYIGQPLEDCYKGLTSLEETSLLEETHRLFQGENLHLSQPFPGVKDMLASLKEQGIKIVALTTRSRRNSLATLQMAGIFPFFDLFLSREDLIKQKPDPEGIIKALTHFGLSSQDALMVGDTDVDILAGKYAKVGTIGVTYGFHKEKIKESNPDYVAHGISDIFPLILKY